jgi:hypothetical protein
MPQNEARAWWADVEHVRESIERRRGGAAESSAPGEPESSRRFARTEAEPPVPRLEELDWPAEIPGLTTKRFEHPARTDRAAGATDERVARRHAQTVTEADRTARGRRSRAEADRRRNRSHRGDDAPARPAEPSATATAAADIRHATADAAVFASRDFDLDDTVAPPPPPGVRRTVQITGRTVPAPRLVEVERRRPGRRPAERVGPRPDRIALYAVLLGFFLILVAATSAHAAI